MRRSALLALSIALLAAPAFAQAPAAAAPAQPMTPPSQQGQVAPVVPADHMHMPPSDTSKPSSKAFTAINEKMHRDMAINFTGDADVDFVRGMIPHHQAAVDMARIVLQYGADPQIKQLAHNIIDSQTSEIATMQAWLAQHAK